MIGILNSNTMSNNTFNLLLFIVISIAAILTTPRAWRTWWLPRSARGLQAYMSLGSEFVGDSLAL